MLPTATVNDVFYRSFLYAVFVSQFLNILCGHKDGPNLVFKKQRIGMVTTTVDLPNNLSALADHIVRIVSVGSYKKMVRIGAFWIIAMVANKQPLRNLAFV